MVGLSVCLGMQVGRRQGAQESYKYGGFSHWSTLVVC